MGDCTVSFDDDGIPKHVGTFKRSTALVTLSNSYATGGDTIPASARTGNMQVLYRARIRDWGAEGYKLSLDSRTAPTKILARWGAAAGAVFGEVTALTDLSTVSCTVEFEGA